MTEPSDRPGLAQAGENRDPWSWEPAMEAVKVMAESGVRFESWDLEQVLGVKLDTPNRWGALMNAAAKQGLIECVGYRVSGRPTRCGGLTRTWRGTSQVRAVGRARRAAAAVE